MRFNTKELDDEDKKNLGKYAVCFFGGMVVGYSIKKVLDSEYTETVKENTLNLIKNYFNPEIHYENDSDIVEE